MPHARTAITVVVFVLLSISAVPAFAAVDFYRFSELVRHKDVRDDLDPEVRLHFAGDTLPALAEWARPDVYSGHGVSISPFGGSPRHCIEAFDKAMVAMIRDAKERGYDTIVDIQAIEGDQPTADATGYRCGPGYKYTGVSLTGTFAMTPAAFKRMVDEEERSSRLTERPPAAKVVRLALAPLVASFLDSPEAKAAAGGRLAMHVGITGPAYRDRYGPSVYGDSVVVGTLGAEEACRRAVVATLASIVEEAEEKKYDTVLRLRSYQDDEYAPYSPNVDCQVGWRSASVKLQGSLATRR